MRGEARGAGTVLYVAAVLPTIGNMIFVIVCTVMRRRLQSLPLPTIRRGCLDQSDYLTRASANHSEQSVPTDPSLLGLRNPRDLH